MSRIGGIFPFPQQAAANNDGTIALASGGIYVLPPGDYLVTPGAQTNLQWFDPNLLGWRNIGDQFISHMFVSADGTNYRLVNMSGVVIGASITNAGSGGTNGIGATATGVGVTFAAPVSGLSAATATAYPIVGGSVQAPTITQAGSGLLVPPVINIDPPPPGGIQATAVATINSTGGIASIVMVNVGAGYTASPNFWIFPQTPNYQGSAIAGVAAGAFPAPGLLYPNNVPPGSVYQPNVTLSGAQLTPSALTGTGTLTGIGILNYGFGYDGTHIPGVTITGCGAAAATAIMSMCCTSVTLGSGGSGYGTGTPPMWITTDGIVSSNINNSIPGPFPAGGPTVVVAGAVSTFTIESPGFGFQKVPNVAVLNTSAIATGQATGTAVCGGVNDTSVVQGRVQ